MTYIILCAVMLIAGRLAPARAALSDCISMLPVSVGENREVVWERGTRWTSLGAREHMGYDHLLRANPSSFRTGQRLLIPGRRIAAGLVNDGVVINLPELMAYRWENGHPVAWYPVSVGQITRRWHTPLGMLRVINKARNPAWYRPSWAGGGVVPPGPNNPLGDRWIGLNRPGYGLHGTNDLASIGRTVSHGCIRFFPAHIRALFDAVAVGTPVVLTYETILVGRDGGIIYLAVVPDVYRHGTNTPARARVRLARYGLADVLTSGALEARLQQADGVARPLLGSDIRVTHNGTPLTLAVGPTMVDGRALLPVRALAEAFGAVVAWDAATRVTTVTRANRNVTLTPEQTVQACGETLAPVRALVEGLGGIVNANDNRIEITL